MAISSNWVAVSLVLAQTRTRTIGSVSPRRARIVTPRLIPPNLHFIFKIQALLTKLPSTQQHSYKHQIYSHTARLKRILESWKWFKNFLTILTLAYLPTILAIALVSALHVTSFTCPTWWTGTFARDRVARCTIVAWTSVRARWAPSTSRTGWEEGEFYISWNKKWNVNLYQKTHKKILVETI